MKWPDAQETTVLLLSGIMIMLLIVFVTYVKRDITIQKNQPTARTITIDSCEYIIYYDGIISSICPKVKE